MEDMKKVKHASCLKATGLMEKKIYFNLSLIERMQLFFHRSICDGCRYFEKQSLFIEKMIKKENVEGENIQSVDNLKSKIINTIDTL